MENPSLREILENEPLKGKINHTLSLTKKPIWMGSNIDDFISMFENFHDTPEGVILYFFSFTDFKNSPKGADVIEDPLFRDWLDDFIHTNNNFIAQLSDKVSYILNPDSAEATNCSHPIIEELKQILKNNPSLEDKIRYTLGNTKKPVWQNKTIDNFIIMFANWLHFKQTPKSVALYFFLFRDFKNSPEGDRVINDELFAPWLHKFMNARGAFLDSTESISMLENWLDAPAIKINDYLKPKEGFKSFNQFFTRTIKEGKRRFEPNSLASPVDGVAYILEEEISPNSIMSVKDDKLSLTKLFGDQPIANEFIGGSAALLFLGAMDYHHFHAPVSGNLIYQRLLAGTYEGEIMPIKDLLQHRRGVMVIESELFGKVAIIPFGMYVISSVHLLKEEGQSVEQGDDLGYFQYGGSTVIVLTQADKANFLQYLSYEENKTVKAGNTIADSI